MLQPKLNVDMSYSFYSLAENRVLTHTTNGLTKMLPNPIHDLRFCGSSHGWLALFNPHTFDLFLYDPISHRHIKLPPIPNFQGHKKVSVTKLILSSSSPDDEDCRAVMMYDCESGLAFCCPGRSKEWTLVDTQRYTWEDDHKDDDGVNKGELQVGTIYDDIAYSSRQNLFFALFEPSELDVWDLSHPSSPRMIKTIKSHYYYSCDDDEFEEDDDDRYTKDGLPCPSKYLVVAPDPDDDNKDDVLLVTRSVMSHVAPDGSYLEYDSYSSHSTLFLYPHMTMDFSIHVYHHHQDDDDQLAHHLKPLADLGDLALFLGSNSHSVALSATRFPQLNPNSIYFTDPYKTRYDPCTSTDHTDLYGGHDIGIFDYGTRIVSPCYYPCDLPNLKRTVPSPMWFFPRSSSSF